MYPRTTSTGIQRLKCAAHTSRCVGPLRTGAPGHTLPPFDSVHTAVKLVHANERGNALWYPQQWSIVNANEAIELRNWLVGERNVCDERILAEPYAHHMTTDVRNAARQLRSIRAPEHKPILIVSNSDQYRYILGTPPHSPNAAVMAAGVGWV